ncbi:MAG: hypothetical protein ACPGOY_12530 [Rhodospirillaceae bacterium]
MSDSKTYSDITPALWTAWERRLPRLATIMGASDVEFDGGDVGQFCFRISLGVASGGFEFAYDYDRPAESVEITILKKPWMITDGMIFSAIDKRIYEPGSPT